MIKVTAMEQARRGEGMTLRFDDGSSLEASLSIVAEFRLFTGRELQDKEYSELKAAAGIRSAKKRAAAIIGTRQMSEHELKKRLKEKGTSEKDADDAADWLRDMGALDDSEYASLIARRYSGKCYGEAKIKDEFYKRGIPRDLWDEALSEYQTCEDGIDSFLSRKLRGSTDKKEFRKAADALYRRGFSWEEIKEALSRYEDGRLSEE